MAADPTPNATYFGTPPVRGTAWSPGVSAILAGISLVSRGRPDKTDAAYVFCTVCVKYNIMSQAGFLVCQNFWRLVYMPYTVDAMKLWLGENVNVNKSELCKLVLGLGMPKP